MKLSKEEIAYKVWCTNDIKSVLPLDVEKIKKYNDVPVSWCTECNSLMVYNVQTNLDKDVKCYCNKCHSTSIKEGHIEEWLKLN
jgi:hypothetical protein